MRTLHRSIFVALVFVLGGLLLVFRSASADAPVENPEMLASSCTNLANWQCVDTRAGLSLCRANNICVIKVDLNNNILRPKVAIGSGGGTEWLSSIGSTAGAYAAINGDYFSGCPDPSDPKNCGEGLTYIDHVNYTRTEFANWQNRRSLGFNDSFDPNIGWPGEQGGYQHMLLGGGPQVTFNGEYRWRCWYANTNTEGNCECRNSSQVVINDEIFGCSANNWWSRPQTFIGFSDDRNTLFLAVSEPGYNKTPHDMHDVLWVLGARNTLKMDGGGSSGMYFNDGGYQFSWNGSRAVANAWVIVPNSDPPPTCNPGADQVAVYVDANYSGQCIVKEIGEYPNPASIGLPNDSISSVRVGGNVKAVLCKDDNYAGGCEEFYGDDSFLGDNSIGNEQVSSMKVQVRAQPLPDLRPYAPDGYTAAVIPSSIPGTHVTNNLYGLQTTYFDWHFINSGNATASGNFYVELWVDSTRYVRYPYSNYAAGSWGGFDDWAETIPMVGWHTVKLIVDPDNAIGESDESNNIWQAQFYWNGSQAFLPVIRR